MARKKFVVGSFKEEKILFEAIKTIKQNNVNIDNVYTPFPVHGLEQSLGYKESKLHTLGFVYGITFFIAILSFMYWVLAIDWPIIYGGKSFFPLLAFIPIVFEVVILLTCTGLVFTFCYWCKLGPFVKTHHFHPQATDDRFVIVLKYKESSEENQLIDLMQKVGAEEINTQIVEKDWWFGFYGTECPLYKEKGKEIIQ
ncbi:MAG: DUF3341 domain-containing protein [Chitinophagaceae bacterium]